MKEWSKNEYFDDSWRTRIQQMAAYIEQGDVVADLGCGKQWLREYLPSLADYVPIDYRERSKDTLVCDFNRHPFPNIYVDVSFISGILEYIEDVRWFANGVINHTAKTIVLSYCSTEMVPSGSLRKKNMWVNHYSKKDIQALFSQAGFELTNTGRVGANAIFVLRRASRKACGVLVHEDAPGNLGDFTQALAAKLMLGDEYHSVYLHRESLHLYRGKRLPVICNGWFSHTQVFPPNDQLVPLYISLHVTPTAQKWFSTVPMINHLKQYAPIGCRDRYTRDFLLGLGVKAYFSGCLTYTLGVKLRENWSRLSNNTARNSQVYLVDPPVKIIKTPIAIMRALFGAFRYVSLIPKIRPLAIEQRGLLRQYVYVAFIIHKYRRVLQEYGEHNIFQTQYLKQDEQDNYEYLFSRIRDRFLNYYQGSAVITGRIHVAIPAIFAGAKVVFLQEDKPSTAGNPRIRDHAQIFPHLVTLSDSDFEGELLASISQDNRQPIDIELYTHELVRDQIQIVSRSVSAFYANTFLH
jgi:hypothetical protein